MRVFVLPACAVLWTLGAAFACSSTSQDPVANGGVDPTVPATNQGKDDGGSANPDKPGSGSLPVAVPEQGANFCQKTLGAMITATSQCCSAEDKASVFYKGIVPVYANAEKVCEKALEASIAKKRVGYDESTAIACFNAFEKALSNVCDGALFAALEVLKDPTCKGAFTGLQATGAPCSEEYECQSGLTCGRDGTCLATPAIGGVCGIPKDSARAVVTFGAHRMCPVGGDCRRGVCTKAGARPGSECDINADCPPEKSNCVLGMCAAAPGNAGAACEMRTDCSLDTFCNRTADAGPGVCTERQKAGTACDPKFEGGSQCKGQCPRTDAGTSTCLSFCKSG
jgi:hypothetical protein